MLGIPLPLVLVAMTASPTTVSVQGALRSAGNEPVDGQYGLTVRLFGAEQDGSELYAQAFVSVPVASGVFDLALEGITPAMLLGAGERYVEVQVEADPPLPRVRLGATPFAVVASVAQSLDCTGCVGPGALAAGSVPVTALGAWCASGETLRRGLFGWECIAVPDGVVGLADLAPVAFSGRYTDLDDLPDLTRYGRIDAANTWEQLQTLGADLDFALHEARRFRFQATQAEPSPCNTASAGLAWFHTEKKQLFVCDGTAFVAFSRLGQLGTENNPAVSCGAILAGGGSVGNGVYWLRPATKTYRAYCDMTLAGGGWTMLLNLDTSDGHVMWWANPLWTNQATRGDPLNAYAGDQKSDAWNDYGAASRVLLVVHQNGLPVGWRVFQKAGTQTMAQYLSLGDNTLIGSSALASNIADISTGERLVRQSTALYANHCVQTGGGCVSGTTGSPDGDRIGSHEGTPSDNNGGGLGNWHDIHYCCAGQSYAGAACNGGPFRTVSEAQGGWVGQAGTYGTDSAAAMTGT